MTKDLAVEPLGTRRGNHEVMMRGSSNTPILQFFVLLRTRERCCFALAVGQLPRWIIGLASAFAIIVGNNLSCTKWRSR
ncbi:hypothetical protein H8A97_03720 [Bradyrhizobium sp. Arg62]|uniref:hypothetical protein n=1 Tax=Bradyrhizobium brasilense TaxID=1419277 RepID=UPI001E5A031C|nr:hypothetical protein [Bradyrhizobium brasilense]MCC8944232.1 hypothetical protein [Bradyrhizobium brasilense]